MWIHCTMSWPLSVACLRNRENGVPSLWDAGSKCWVSLCRLGSSSEWSSSNGGVVENRLRREGTISLARKISQQPCWPHTPAPLSTSHPARFQSVLRASPSLLLLALLFYIASTVFIVCYSAKGLLQLCGNSDEKGASCWGDVKQIFSGYSPNKLGITPQIDCGRFRCHFIHDNMPHTEITQASELARGKLSNSVACQQFPNVFAVISQLVTNPQHLFPKKHKRKFLEELRWCNTSWK